MTEEQEDPAPRLPGKRQMLVNAGSAWGFKLASMVVSLVTTAVAVREYKLGGMGLILLASQVATYAGLVELGIPSSLSRRLPGLLANKNLNQAYQLCATCLIMLLCSAALGLIMVPVALFLLPSAFAIPAEQKDVAGVLFALTVGSIALQMPLRIGYGMLSSAHRFASYFNIEMGSMIIKMVAIVVCLYFFDPPVWVYVLLTILPVLGAAIIEYKLGRSVLPDWKFAFSQVSRSSLIELVSLSSAVMLGSLASAIVVHGGGLMLAVFSSPQIVAEFSLPSVLAFNLMAFAASASAFLSPIASQLVGRDENRLAYTVTLTSRYSVLAAAAIFVGIAALGRIVLQIWIGPETSPDALAGMYLVLLIASLSGVLSIPGTTARGALVAMGHHWRVAYIELITGSAGLAVGIVTAISLDVPPPLSVAASFCIANLARGILLANLFGRSVGLHRSFFWSNLLAITPATLCGMAIVVSAAIWGGGNFLVTLLAGALAGIVFIVLALYTGVEPEHRQQLFKRTTQMLSIVRRIRP